MAHVFSFLLLFFDSVPPENADEIRWLLIASSTIFFIVPLTVLSILYALIGMTLRRSAHRFDMEQMRSDSETSRILAQSRRSIVRMLCTSTCKSNLLMAPTVYHWKTWSDFKKKDFEISKKISDLKTKFSKFSKKKFEISKKNSKKFQKKFQKISKKAFKFQRRKKFRIVWCPNVESAWKRRRSAIWLRFTLDRAIMSLFHSGNFFNLLSWTQNDVITRWICLEKCWIFLGNCFMK